MLKQQKIPVEPYIQAALEAAAERINQLNSKLGFDLMGPTDVAHEVIAAWARDQVALKDR